MFTAIILLASAVFAESEDLALQIALDREGFSCNTIDGVWGVKSERAFAAAPLELRLRLARDLPAGRVPLFRYDTVTADELASLVKIPDDPAAKALLPRMGYESIREMYAERGHMSERALERLNPGLDWSRISAGTKIRLPDLPRFESLLDAWPRKPGTRKQPEAARVDISLSRFEISVYDGENRLMALFPCSIAKDKSKRPAHGELTLRTPIARPNYTYTPDFTPAGQKPKRHILPEGPNAPIGVVWMGLDLPTYGIHGTPKPETIGSAESHGCFRLSNWNAARLYALCPTGTKIRILP